MKKSSPKQKDLTAFIKRAESANKSLSIVESFRKQEELLLAQIKEGEAAYHLKEIIEGFIQSGIKDGSLNKLKTIINFGQLNIGSSDTTWNIQGIMYRLVY